MYLKFFFLQKRTKPLYVLQSTRDNHENNICYSECFCVIIYIIIVFSASKFGESFYDFFSLKLYAGFFLEHS